MCIGEVYCIIRDTTALLLEIIIILTCYVAEM